MPRIAVLMAAYNADDTIHAAVGSVLNSTVPCDLFIVDDCSRIPVATVLGTVPGNVEILRLDRNGGPAAARNHGIAHILSKGSYSYIAIADADDLVYPERFAKQAAYLDANPNVAVVSAWTRYVTESGEAYSFQNAPGDPVKVRHCMFFNLSVAHTACMFRARAFERFGAYSERYPVAEDYELLRRIGRHSQIGNLAEFLGDYRVSSGSISMRRHRRQLWDRLCIQIKYFEILEWRAWAGALRTALQLLIPAAFVRLLKRAISDSIADPTQPRAPLSRTYDLDDLRWRVLMGG